MAFNNKGKKTTKIILATAVATNIIAVSSPTYAASQTEAERLVKKAEKLAASLQKEVTYESREKLYPKNKLGLPNMKLYKDTEIAFKKAGKEVNKLKGNAKKELQIRLAARVETPYKYATAYIKVVNVAKELDKTNKSLNNSLSKGNIDSSVIKVYTQFALNVKKFSQSISQVRGTQTKQALRDNLVNKFNKTEKSVSYAITIQRELSQLDSYLATGKDDQAKSLQKNIKNRLTEGKKFGYISGTLARSYEASLAKATQEIDKQYTYTAESNNSANPTVYGGTADKPKVINHDLVIEAGKDQYIKVVNITVNGNIIIKGNETGAGTVTFDHVNVNDAVNGKGGEIIVEDVAEHSFHITNVKADKLIIKDINGGNIVAKEGTQIQELVVVDRAGETGEINLVSSKGAFGQVNVVSTGGKTYITLSGDFSGSNIVIKVPDAQIIIAKDAIIKELDIKSESNIHAQEGAKVESINLAVEQKGQKVELSGSLKETKVTISNTNVSVDVAKDTVIKEVSKANNVTEDITIINYGTIDIATDVKVEVPSSTPASNPAPAPSPSPTPVAIQVTLASGSLGAADNKKITGLKMGTKYIVSVDGKTYGVQADGTLGNQGSAAVALTGTEIIGLTNGKNYKVEVQAVTSAFRALTFNSIKGGNSSKENITGDLKLPTTADGVTITWSSNKTVIDKDGKVTRSTVDTAVVLTATIRSNEDQSVVQTKEFELTVVGDQIGPTVTGVTDNKAYNANVTPVFAEGTATLTKDGGSTVPFVTGTEITDEGSYELVVTDAVGNVTTFHFSIDKTVPVVTGVTDSQDYNVDVTPVFTEAVATITKDGESPAPFVTGTALTEDGKYELVVTDQAGNVTTVHFTIDKTSPTVTGITDNKAYNANVTPVFAEGTATLTKDGGSTVPFVSGTEITDEGSYELVVTDAVGNVTTFHFSIDKTVPVVTGVTDSQAYNVDVTPVFTESVATITKDSGSPAPFVTGTAITEDGKYELVVTDQADNVTTVHFTIDQTGPTVTGVTNNKAYKNNVTPIFVEGTATLTKDGGSAATFESGTEITAEGSYDLIVIDGAGNSTSTHFSIDKTAPSVLGVVDGQTYNVDVWPEFKGGTGTLSKDGGPAVAYSAVGYITDEGKYELVVTDQAGNVTTVHFTIDKTGPTVTGITDNKAYNANVTPVFTEGTATLTKDGGSTVPFVSGTEITDEGSYELVVTDAVGNATTFHFSIDKTVPVVTGVTDSQAYNVDVTPVFTETAATITKDSESPAPFVTGTAITEDGKYELVVTDQAGNVTTVHFTIDQTGPTVTGIIDNKAYNVNVTPIFVEGTATLTKDGGSVAIFESGTEITAEGSYDLIVIDGAGNSTSTHFSIDKTAPRVLGVVDGRMYNFDVSPEFKGGTGTLSKDGGSAVAYSAVGYITDEGKYELVVTDQAGNVTTVHFTIDKTGPTITGVTDNKAYKNNVTPIFVEGTATLTKDGGSTASFESGTEITAEGNYDLVVTDAVGNETTTHFSIDKSVPVVMGVTESKIYNVNVTPNFTEGTATLSLNGGPAVSYISGQVITAEGTYELVVTDQAGNETTVHFGIDKTGPTVTEVIDNKAYNTNVTPNFTEGTAILLLNGGNIVSYASGTVIKDQGSYVLVVVDGVGNLTTTHFSIDKTLPVVTGVTESKVYNTDVAPKFTEGTAILMKDGGPAISYKSGTAIIDEGKYELNVIDQAGNVTTVHFTIDKTGPTVTGVVDGKAYQYAYPEFTEGTATLSKDGEPPVSFISGGGYIGYYEGKYELNVTDQVGNTTKIHFTIDRTAPTITAVDIYSAGGDGTFGRYQGDKLRITFSENIVPTELSADDLERILTFTDNRWGYSIDGYNFTNPYSFLSPSIDIDMIKNTLTISLIYGSVGNKLYIGDTVTVESFYKDFSDNHFFGMPLPIVIGSYDGQ